MKSFVFAIITLIYAMLSCVHAEELVMDFQGIDLLGNLEVSQGGLQNKDIVLIVHDTLSSKQENLISGIQAGLKGQGINSLAINLSLGLDMRKGRYDCKIEHNHRHKDALGEMAKWIKWLLKQKVRHVHLLGQGRGANQVALYGRNAKKSKLGKLILVSPMSWSFEKAETEYRSLYRKSLSDVLNKAKAMIADGEGDTLMEADFLGCKGTRVTAHTFENYYSPNAEYHTPSLLDSLQKKDVLVLTGEYDNDSQEIVSMLQSRMGTGHHTLKVIPGANKGFGGIYKDHLVTEVLNFLK